MLLKLRGPSRTTLLKNNSLLTFCFIIASTKTFSLFPGTKTWRVKSLWYLLYASERVAEYLSYLGCLPLLDSLRLLSKEGPFMIKIAYYKLLFLNGSESPSDSNAAYHNILFGN